MKDALTRLDNTKMIIENIAVHDDWHKAWSAKEEATRKCLVRSSEKLEEHAKELKPLVQGDTVFVQNQDPQAETSKKSGSNKGQLSQWAVRPIPCQNTWNRMIDRPQSTLQQKIHTTFPVCRQ